MVYRLIKENSKHLKLFKKSIKVSKRATKARDQVRCMCVLFLPDGEHVISRIETHMSDGTTYVSSTLTPETAQLLARLNPSMFPPGSLVQVSECNPVCTLG